MKGWLFQGTGIAPKLIEKEDPKPADNEVLISIKASGLCMSDVHALEEEHWMRYFKAPVIFGHEFAGDIVEVGKDIKDFKVGDRVGVCPQNADDPFDISGYTRDGGYATMATVLENQLVKIPDGVSYAYAAAGTDAGATSYHGLFTMGGCRKGMKVGIIGIGGLGQYGAQMAKIAGCEVYAAARSEAAKELAAKIGCDKIFTDVREMAELMPDLIVDFAGSDKTVSGAVDAVKRGGTVVVVGGVDTASTISMISLTTKEVRLIGSCGNTKADIEGVYQMYTTGELKPQLYFTDLEGIGEGLEKLAKGGYRGRLVALM